MTSHPEQETMHKVIVIRGQEHYTNDDYYATGTFLPTRIIGDDTVDTVVHTVTADQLAALRLACGNNSDLRLLVLVPPQTEEFNELLATGMKLLQAKLKREEALKLASKRDAAAKEKAMRARKMKQLEKLQRELAASDEGTANK